jgi:succinyl-diaminopimelate desuccinylase
MPADTTSITEFAQKLVQTPSQSGIDPPGPVLDTAYTYARSLGLPAIKLVDDNGQPVALVAEIRGAHPGKTWAVNATLDTAPVGDRSLWNANPFSGDVRNDILQGRGAGDSKLAAAMFTHLARDMMAAQKDMHGTFQLILDADEHTGNFSGIKAVLKAGYKPDGIMIGYPGDDKLVVGSRGFSRYEIDFTGKGGHSGAARAPEDNALVRMAALVGAFYARPPQAETEATDDFGLQPKLTVTEMGGGDGFAVVPSKAVMRLDVRLTPAFNEAAADKYIRDVVAGQDLQNQVPENRATVVRKVSAEPAFLTPEQAELRVALREAVADITGKPLPELVVGPSNIGNFLAKQGIEVTAGYGVPAKGVHAPNEQANLKPLAKVYNVYQAALKKLFKF